MSQSPNVSSDQPQASPSLSPDATPAPDVLFSRRLDRIEQALVAVFFVGFVAAIARHVYVSPSPAKEMAAATISIIAEGIVFVFVMIRRRSDKVTPNVFEWVLAVGATLGPLLVRPIEHLPTATPAGAEASNTLLALGLASLLIGLTIQLGSKLTLGRSFGILPAHRGLVRSGPYRFVRHPIYAGYVFHHLGFILLWPTWWNAAVLAVAWVLQIMRLLAEERWLAQADPAYKQYQQDVPYRLIPFVF